jgi:predicted O-methyltransferase YrrM
VTAARALHRAVFAAIVAREGYTRGAELGTGHGHLAARLLAACPSLELLTVDCFSRPAWRAAAEARLAPFGSRVRLVVASTIEASWGVPDGSLDFVFVDAGHTYAAVKADLAAWRPKVRRGGWFGGHDYHPAFPGVQRAVDEAFGLVQLSDGWIWRGVV